MSKIAERLRQALSFAGLSKAELGRKTGITNGQISTYATGQFEPKYDKLQKMAEALGVNEAWLAGSDDVPMERVTLTKHEGEMGYAYQSFIVSENQKALGLSPEAQQVGIAYDKAEPAIKTSVKKLLDIEG